ncbi:hypothetical protein CRYUN_Cryun25bG0061300 [Craigia yunnanensis]
METMCMTPQTPNDPFYMSAPVCPRRISLEGLCFFSVPTSPTRSNLKPDTEPTTPKTCEDSSSHIDEFEFETSPFDVREYEVESEQKSESKVEKPHKNHGRKESFPAMAFVDELFSDGKVMPLKPPPRLQYPNDKRFDEQSSTLSSPRSPTGFLRLLPFQRRSLWNDDFDPFMVALENVKEEKVGKSQAKSHRRARSMSAFKEIGPKGANDLSGSSQQKINQMGLILPTQQSEPNLNKRMENNESDFCMWIPNKNRQMGHQEQVNQVKKSSLKSAEPKGVLFARRARLVKVGHEQPRKPSLITPKVEAGESAKESGLTCTKKTKSQKIKNFLLWRG